MSNPNPQKKPVACADRASKHETKGDNAAMERFLSEDDHLKKSLVVGKDNDKHKDTAKSSSLGKDRNKAELNSSDGRQH